MFKTMFDRRVLHDPSWCHWAATVPLLAGWLMGCSWSLAFALVLCAVMADYFYVRVGRVGEYPVQVRIVYLLLLAVGILPGMHWLHWVQLFGTTLMVTIGYCPLIRVLSLFPPNRSEPLTAYLVWRVLRHEPRAGGLLRGREFAGDSRINCGTLAMMPS